MDYMDMSSMSREDARAYVIEYVTTLKTIERDIALLSEEEAVWNKRMQLASSKGAADLLAAAEERLAALTARKKTLETEQSELAEAVRRLREKLPMAGMAERSVDPDALLAALRMEAGQSPDDRDDQARSEADFLALSADDTLAALKRKMQEKENS